jgi:hypothetical protein
LQPMVSFYSKKKKRKRTKPPCGSLIWSSGSKTNWLIFICRWQAMYLLCHRSAYFALCPSPRWSHIYYLDIYFNCSIFYHVVIKNTKVFYNYLFPFLYIF